MSTPNPAAVKSWLLDLQARIVQALEDIDGKPFLTDTWERTEGGGGISRLIEEGNVFERGGCNFSHVQWHEPAAVGDGRAARTGRTRLGSHGRLAGAAPA
jgi:coproporphyrinogen oxidase (EC 1.3.3.3)